MNSTKNELSVNSTKYELVNEMKKSDIKYTLLKHLKAEVTPKDC